MMRTRRPIPLRRRLAWRPKAEILENRRLLSGDIVDLALGGGATPPGPNAQTVDLLTFTSTRAEPRAGDFSTWIDWGDGSASAGVVIPGPIEVDGEMFTVTGKHEYPSSKYGDGYHVIVSVEDAGGAGASDEIRSLEGAEEQVATTTSFARLSTIQILPSSFDPATAVISFPGGSIGNTSIGYPAGFIHWGDGTTDDGILSGIGATDQVTFTHHFGPYGPGVYTAFAYDLSGDSITYLVQIEAAYVFATGQSYSGTTLASSAEPAPLAFVSVAAGISTADLTATVDWGDGTTTTGIVTPGAPAGSDVPVGSSPFTVSGSHAYARAGTYVPRVVVHDGFGFAAVAEAKATITDESLTPSPQSSSEIAGAPATGGAAANGLVGFGGFSTTAPDATAADFTATIDWGDGTSSAGVIEQPAGSATSSVFEVGGSHLYADDISYPVRITVTSVRGASTTIESQIAVLPPSGPGPYGDLEPVVVGAAPSLRSAPGLATDGKALATFAIKNPGPLTSIADYSATIDWGDGTTGEGVVSLVGEYESSGFDFFVSGAHKYAAAGQYPLTITLQHASGGVITPIPGAVYQGAASVNPESIQLYATPVGAFPGVVYSAATGNAIEVATFTDAAPGLESTDYSASIDWGDGSTSAGRVSGDVISVPNPPGGHNSSSPTVFVFGFDVRGDHTYATPGEYTVRVTVTSGAGVVATSTENAEVGPIYVLPNSSSGFANQAGGSFNLATLTVETASPGANGFQVGIDWGDGKSSSGTVELSYQRDPTENSPGLTVLDVSGTHSYARPGTYHPLVYVIDRAGDLAKTAATATIQAEEFTSNPELFYGIAGRAVAGQVVGRFISSDPDSEVADYLGAIDWGDGTTTLGTVLGSVFTEGVRSESTGPSQVVSPTSGVYEVEGTHTYARPGLYVIRVTVVSDRESCARFNTGVEILPTPEAIAASPIAAQATVGQDSSSGLALAAFTESDPAIADPGSFVAAIDWGDGSAPTGGTVRVDPGAAGTFLVSGDHVYEEPGLHFLKITVLRVGGASTVLKGGVDVLAAPPSTPPPIPPPRSPQFLVGMPASSEIETTANAPTPLLGLASLRDSDPSVGAGLIAASVDWGDGSTSTLGEVVATSDGFEILGGHTFTKPGAFVVRVTVATRGTEATVGGSTTIADQAVVAPAPARRHPTRPKAVKTR